MTVEFQYTFEDYREANLAHAVFLRKRQGPKTRFWLFVAAGMAIFVFATIGLYVAADRFGLSNNAFFESIQPIVPWLSILIPLWIWLYKGAGSHYKHPTNMDLSKMNLHGRPKARDTFIAFIVCAAIAALVYLQMSAGRGTSRSPSHFQWPNTMSPFLLWIILFSLVYFGLPFVSRSQIRRQWNKQTQLHHLYTVEITADTFEMDSPLFHMKYQWDFFPAYIETPNLFMLYISDGTSFFMLLPKRAFANPTELDATRNLLISQVGQRQSAFPVLSAQKTVSL